MGLSIKVREWAAWMGVWFCCCALTEIVFEVQEISYAMVSGVWSMMICNCVSCWVGSRKIDPLDFP